MEAAWAEPRSCTENGLKSAEKKNPLKSVVTDIIKRLSIKLLKMENYSAAEASSWLLN